MKRFLPIVIAAFIVTAGALAEDVRSGYSAGNKAQPVGVTDSNGRVYPLKGSSSGVIRVEGPDAGPVTVERAPGAWDCAGTGAGTITSTGTSNHGNLTVTAGGYYIGYCTNGAHVGASTTLLADGGNLATCANPDAGTIPHDECRPFAANERFRIDLRNTTRNSIGATSSAAATANCPVTRCAN